MNQTNPKSDDFSALQAHATLRLRIVERLLKRLDNEAIPGKEARKIGCTILLLPPPQAPRPKIQAKTHTSTLLYLLREGV